MNHHIVHSFPALILLAAMFACNLPVEQVPPPSDVQTAAALTVQAVMAAPSSAAASPSATSGAPALTGMPAQTTTVTATYSVPMLTVRESTNCRTGPGEDYEIVFTYLSGKKLEIVGRYDPGNFWLVKSSESRTGTCWLWGQYVDVTGSYWAVSSVTPPPTATSAPPRAPSIQKWKYECSFGTLTFTVNWADIAGESGYRIFRNGGQLAELPANSTSFTDTFDVSADLGQTVKYYVQAYGPGGTKDTAVMEMNCQE